MFGKINDAYETVKNGLEVEVSLATAEQKEKLADAKLSLADLKDFIADLKEDNRVLKQQLSVKNGLKPDVGHEWLVMEKDEDAARRYCQVCYYDREKVIPLNTPSTAQYHHGQRFCPVCKTYRK